MKIVDRDVYSDEPVQVAESFEDWRRREIALQAWVLVRQGETSALTSALTSASRWFAIPSEN